MALNEFKVSAVIFDKTTNTPVVLLQNSELNRVVPIWIGTCEAISIAMSLNNEKYPRPLTHDLILNVLEKLEYKIKDVIIYQVKNDVFYANISIVSAFNFEETKRIDARASDAIALALKYNAKIFLESDVVLASGIALKQTENYEGNTEVEEFLKRIKNKKGGKDGDNYSRKN